MRVGQGGEALVSPRGGERGASGEGGGSFTRSLTGPKPNQGDSPPGLPIVCPCCSFGKRPESGRRRKILTEDHPRGISPSLREMDLQKAAQRREKRNSPNLRTEGEEVVTPVELLFNPPGSRTPYRGGGGCDLDLATFFDRIESRTPYRGGGGCDPRHAGGERVWRPELRTEGEEVVTMDSSPCRGASSRTRTEGEEVVTPAELEGPRDYVPNSVQRGRRL